MTSQGMSAASITENKTIPVVVGSPSSDQDDDESAPHALIVVLPGALLGPADYAELLNAFQTIEMPMKIFLTVAHLDWRALFAPIQENCETETSGAVRKAFENAVEASRKAGFIVEHSDIGGYHNVFVCMHSASALWALDFPMTCAGVIFLGSSVVSSVRGFMWSDVVELPKPVMHIFGSLDGQYRTNEAALIAGNVGRLSAMLGPERAGWRCPICVVPGMNHALMSNGIVNYSRGDIEASISQEDAVKGISWALRAFIVSNAFSDRALRNEVGGRRALLKAAVEEEREFLGKCTRSAFEYFSPYLRALGRTPTPIELQKRWYEGLPVSSYAVGSEVAVMPMVEHLAHPGELKTAEATCCEAQKLSLKEYFAFQSFQYEKIASQIRITAVVHTSFHHFKHAQPYLFPPIEPKLEAKTSWEANKIWTLQCHVYLLRDLSRLKSNAPWLGAKSPLYWMNLMEGRTIALEMGCTLQEEAKGIVSAASLHEKLYDEALEEVHPLFKDYFIRHGTKLAFPHDRDVTGEHAGPSDFLEATQSDYQDAMDDGRITAIRYCSTAIPDSQNSGHEQEFAGNCYVKVQSKAWFHEWIMIRGLRAS